MDPFEEEPPQRPPAKVFVYKGKEPTLSRHAKKYFGKRGVVFVMLPSNGRGDERNVINGGKKP